MGLRDGKLSPLTARVVCLQDLLQVPQHGEDDLLVQLRPVLPTAPLLHLPPETPSSVLATLPLSAP